MIIQFISCCGHKRQTPFIDILAASRICAKCVSFFKRLRGRLYGDFHPGLKFQLGLAI